MAVDEVGERLDRIAQALEDEKVSFALVGGQAVALWVATKDPAAVRTTKDVDILLARGDLGRARAAAHAADMDYFEVLGVGMFVDRDDPNPRRAVHLIWEGERIRPDDPLPAPTFDERMLLEPSRPVVTVAALVRMKLMANRDQDRVHLRDMIEVGLVDRQLLDDLPDSLRQRLGLLLTEMGR